MKNLRFGAAVTLAVLTLGVTVAFVQAQSNRPGDKPYEPRKGQSGKDVIWVPTPDPTAEKMLDAARTTPDDYVIDLGSGDGRLVIAAAKRGIRGHGVEFNPDMVEYARKKAAEAGVADKASFIQGDMYEADISKATVLPLFLLSENLERLVPKFLTLKPGTRIVINGYQIYGWEPDQTVLAEGDCGYWCTVYLYIVPAPAEGTWQLGEQVLTLKQEYQKITGTLGKSAIENATLNGNEIRFSVGRTQYMGRIEGAEMKGRIAGARSGVWMARKG
jgi:SAM-dependent methyltransferase